MRAFVLNAPGEGVVADVEPPRAGPGEVVVEVARVGLCGTDVEFFTGHMQYLHDGQANYPIRLGHEWCGRVAEVGEGVATWWLGRFVTGDTMLGCGRCRRCTTGRQHVCADRYEIGVRHGWPGALAERLPVPVSALHAVPDHLGPTRGALVEPGGNALRAALATEPGPGRRVLVLGPGTIGLLVAMFVGAYGAEVHLAGRDERSLEFARSLGFTVWTTDALPEVEFDAVVDAANGPGATALAAARVGPAGRLVLIGISDAPPPLDPTTLVLNDITVVGVLSASPALAATIDAYARGLVDPTPLVAATVGLGDVAGVLGGWRPADAGPGPKIHVDPMR